MTKWHSLSRLSTQILCISKMKSEYICWKKEKSVYHFDWSDSYTWTDFKHKTWRIHLFLNDFPPPCSSNSISLSNIRLTGKHCVASLREAGWCVSWQVIKYEWSDGSKKIKSNEKVHNIEKSENIQNIFQFLCFRIHSLFPSLGHS